MGLFMLLIGVIRVIAILFLDRKVTLLSAFKVTFG
jgi:hypothetical protein